MGSKLRRNGDVGKVNTRFGSNGGEVKWLKRFALAAERLLSSDVVVSPPAVESCNGSGSAAMPGATKGSLATGEAR